MKTLKYLLFILIATTMFASCKTAKTITDLERAIPGNATFVVNFNNKQIIDKGELSKYKEFNLYPIIRKEIANESEKLVSLFDEFMADTRTSGLNLDQSYIYGINKDARFNVVFLFKIDNVKTFDAKLKEMLNAENESEDEPQIKNNYKQLTLDYTTNLLWNDDKLCIVTGSYNWDEEPIDFGYLFAENAENITTNADFVEFAKKGYDVGFWASYDRVMEFLDKHSYSGIAASSIKQMMVLDTEGTFFHAYMNFENGEAKLGGLVSPKGKLDDILKKYSIKKDFDNSLLKYFPEKSYSVMKLSMNVQEYIRLVKDQVAKVNEAHKKERGGDEEEFDYYYYSPFGELDRILKDPTVKTIIEGLGGDMLISMYDFQQGMIPMPLASLAFTVKDKNVFDVILALIPKEIVKEQKGYYTFMAGPMPIAYAAYKKDVVYVTTDEKAVEAFLDKGFDKNLSHSEFAKDLKNDVFLWNMNLDLESYPGHITMLLRNQMGRDFKTLESFMNIYKYIDYKITKDNEVEFVVKMKNTSNNSLKVILKNIDENVSSMILGN